jgi:hypothetical protein
MWRDYIKPNGTLDEAKLLGRELLYQGRNGRNVERCLIQDKEELKSFIFKPLTNEHQTGKEVWAHHYLLPKLPNLDYPQLLAHSDPYAGIEQMWFIFEDLGDPPLAWSEDQIVSAARCIPHWQKLSIKLIPSSFKGDKPLLEETIGDIQEDLYSGMSIMAHLTTSCGESPSLLTDLQRIVIHMNSDQELVVSHGDLHLGNLALKDGRIAILDWEHVHINSIYWDLFGLLEMSHPYYERQTDRQQLRERALQAYWEEFEALGHRGDYRAFMRNYYSYASVYSAWMLLLINKDLYLNFWPQEQLLRQQREIIQTWTACMDQVK